MKSIRDYSTRVMGKLYFPAMLTIMLTEMEVPQYKDDLIVKEQRKKWDIDLKDVSRMRNRKERNIGATEMTELLTEVLNQNSTLMDTILHQRNEFIEKLEELRDEVRLMSDFGGQKERDEVEAKVIKLKKMVLHQKAEIGRLRSKLPEEEVVPTHVAASTSVALPIKTTVWIQDPTPSE